jgi:hypothetical protein
MTDDACNGLNMAVNSIQDVVKKALRISRGVCSAASPRHAVEKAEHAFQAIAITVIGVQASRKRRTRIFLLKRSLCHGGAL